MILSFLILLVVLVRYGTGTGTGTGTFMRNRKDAVLIIITGIVRHRTVLALYFYCIFTHYYYGTVLEYVER